MDPSQKAPPRGANQGAGRSPGAYHDFWDEVGERFPDLGGATSTRYYRMNEERLLAEHLPGLGDSTLLKTDLWDEAKNTRILQWAARQGASVFGVDVSEPTVRQARACFGEAGLRVGATVADVRQIPFRGASFDAVYSMGTIEHFRDPEVALREMNRVLKPGGRAIVGVPNRWDPFLRPLLVAMLWRLGLYAYGYERSFSRAALRRMVEAAGFRTRAETGILFIPGWLRMLDLACHSWLPRLAPVTGAAVRPFVFLDRKVAAFRRHGYLIVVVAEKER